MNVHEAQNVEIEEIITKAIHHNCVTYTRRTTIST
jgi:hypothetical protein